MDGEKPMTTGALEASDQAAADVAKSINRVTLEHIESIVTDTEFLIPACTPLLTLCVLQLRNGFTVTGESACADPANFNAELGRKLAHEDAMRKVWPLEGYLLKERLYWERDKAKNLAVMPAPPALVDGAAVHTAVSFAADLAGDAPIVIDGVDEVTAEEAVAAEEDESEPGLEMPTLGRIVMLRVFGVEDMVPAIVTKVQDGGKLNLTVFADGLTPYPIADVYPDASEEAAVADEGWSWPERV